MGSTRRQAKFWNRLALGLTLLGLLVVLLTGFSLWMHQHRLPTVADATFQKFRPRDQAVMLPQDRWQPAPEDAGGYLQLGTSYLQKARETGDASYYSRAQEALKQALEVETSPNWLKARAMAGMGAAFLGRHEFNGAQEWARHALELDSSYASAFGVLGDAQLELGQYDDAAESFQAMVDLKPGLSSYARVARIQELRGDVGGAIEAMKLAVAAGAPKSEATAWARVQLGNLYFNSGNINKADEQYQAALKEFDSHYLALASLGKARAAQGDYNAAIDLLEQSVAVIPQPAALATLGDLYSLTGQPDRAQLQYDTVELIAQLAAVNQQVYNRDLALFYADHDLKLDTALEMSEKELEFRKDIYGYDALAWSLFKNQRLSEAADAINQAMRLGTQDASIFFHAGMIYHGLGDWSQAKFYLEKALDTNPHFSLLHSQQARDLLEELSDKHEASRGAVDEVAP